MRFANNFLIFLIVLLLAGCAASGPIFQKAEPPGQGKALVYFYRPASFVLGGRDAQFYINDKNIVNLSSKGYTRIYLDPGTYQIKQKWPIDLIRFKDLELALAVEANNTYYYRFYSDGEFHLSGGPTGAEYMRYEWSLRQVTELEASQEIFQCHYQAPN